MNGIDQCRYWSSDESVEHYVSEQRVPECMAMVSMTLDFYQEVHPEWKSNGSNIPLILDVGCGCGQLSAPLSAHCGKMIAVDISPSQIQMAKRINARNNIEYKVASATEISHHCPANEVDIIVVGMAAHYFDDDEFYKEVRKCLKPNGVIAIFGRWNHGIQHEEERFRNYFSDFEMDKAADDTLLRVFDLSINSYRDLYFPFENAKRREVTLYPVKTQSEIFDMYLSVQTLFRQGVAVIKEMVTELPPQETYTIITKVFGIFCKL